MILASSLALAVAVPAAAYQIGSGSIAKKGFDLHETFTALARTCLSAGLAQGVGCTSLFPEVSQKSMQMKAKASNSEPYASRWPDDPTRMLDRDPSKIRFGAQLFDDCESALGGGGAAIDQAGLLCSSHYGRLQFMHAQATANDQNPADTRRKMLAWAMFAYRAATDPSFRSTGYCQAVAATADAGLKAALTLGDQSLCEDRRVKILGLFPKRYNGWKVGTLFALHCPNPLQEKACWERTGDYGDETARMAARGALLHLIQDSFSQAHAVRVNPGERAPGPRGPFEAKIVCRAPTLFYDYIVQNRPMPDDRGQTVDDPHAAADFPPTLDGSCLVPKPEVDDIITASAMVLHYVDHPDARAFETYMRTRVFPG
jgi:hypothetical protein